MIDSPSVGRKFLPLLWMVVLTLSARTTVGADFARALPGDCVGIATIRDLGVLKTRLPKAKWLQYLSDPAMASYVDGVKTEFKNLSALASRKMGLNVEKLLSLPTGQITGALRLYPGDFNKDPFLYLLIDVTGNEEVALSMLKSIDAKLEENGLTRRVAGGVTAFSQGEAKPRQQLVYTLKGGVLLVGNDPEEIAKIAGNLGGVENSMAENPRLLQFRQKNDGAGDAEVFVDIAKIISIIKEEQGDLPQTVTRLGVTSFQGAGLSLALGKGEFDQLLQVSLLSRGSNRIMSLVKMPAKSARPEPWVPADVESYFSMNWDLDSFYKTLVEIIEETSPGAVGQAEAALALLPSPDDPLITSFSKDLVGPLGNRLSVVSDIADVADQPTGRSVIAWELDNAEPIRALLDKTINRLGGGVLERKSIRGNVVYTFPLGEMMRGRIPGNEGPLPVGVIGFTVTKTHLLLATHVELLDKLLGFDGQAGLGEDRAYRQVAAHFPARASGLIFQRAEGQMRATWRMVKSGQLAKPLQQAMRDPDTKDYLGIVTALLDGKKLPDFEQVKKYFSMATGGYMLMDDDGARLVFFAIR